jgi:hypothetical protein
VGGSQSGLPLWGSFAGEGAAGGGRLGQGRVSGSLVAIPRRYQFFGSGSVLGSCFRVKNLPRFLPRFLEPVLELSSVRFSVFMRSPEFFLDIPNFG